MPHIHRTGPTLGKHYPVKLVSYTGAKENDIQPGDLLSSTTSGTITQVVPATAYPWTTDEQTTCRNFAAAFIGVASGRSDKDAPLDLRDITILVNQDGEFELDCTLGNYQVGQGLRPAKAAGNALLQTVNVTSDAASIIFWVTENRSNTTRIKATITKTIPKRT